MAMLERNARWAIGVVDHDSGTTPVIAYFAKPGLYDDAVRRVRAGGWTRTSAHEFQQARWPVARSGHLHGAVDIYAGHLVRFTTGRASFYAVDPAAGQTRFATGHPTVHTAGPNQQGMPMTPMWLSAARERRALVTVLPYVPPEPDSTPERIMQDLTTAADTRTLWAGLCETRFDIFHPSMRAPETRR